MCCITNLKITQIFRYYKKKNFNISNGKARRIKTCLDIKNEVGHFYFSCMSYFNADTIL